MANISVYNMTATCCVYSVFCDETSSLALKFLISVFNVKLVKKKKGVLVIFVTALTISGSNVKGYMGWSPLAHL